MSNVKITTWSDDCANAYQDGESVGPDESELWGKWWPLKVNEFLHVGDFMVTYGDGWEFHLRSVEEGDSIGVDWDADPEHEDGCMCDECYAPEGPDHYYDV